MAPLDSSNPEEAVPSQPAYWRVLLPVLAFPAALKMIEYIVQQKNAWHSWGWPEWKVYLTGQLWSWLFWISAFVWGGWWVWKGGHRRRFAWGFSASICVWILLAYFISYKYLKDMYHLPNVHVLQFTLYEWKNAWVLARDTLHWWHVPVVLALLSFLVYWLGKHLRKLAVRTECMTFWRRTILLAVLGAGFTGSSIMALGWHRFQDPLPWDANWSRAFFQYGLMLGGNKTNLQCAHRMALSAHARPENHNVLIIVHESLRADAVLPQVRLLNSFSEDTLSPHILSRLHDSLYSVFPIAYSNSGATNVSVPCLATGLPPEAGTYDFHRAPTFWNIAKTLGYRTLLFSSQDWRWEHFDEFFLDRSVDVAVHRRHFPAAPTTNDVGIDDRLIVDSLLNYLHNAPRSCPFFAVIQFNGTHGPFYAGPAGESLPFYSHDRYRPSVRLLDENTDRLLAGLEKEGFYDSTLVLYTSDHGENIRSRNIPRLGNFYEDTHRIPFWIKWPRDPAWIESHKAWLENARQWTSRPVQNLDIVPTLVDYWGLSEEKAFAGKYAGSSLLRPVKENRILSGQNTGEIRAWSPEGCFVFRPPFKLILSNHTPPQFFDLSADPLEERNLWDSDSVRASNELWLREYFRGSKGRLELCRRLGKNCPEQFLNASPST